VKVALKQLLSAKRFSPEEIEQAITELKSDANKINTLETLKKVLTFPRLWQRVSIEENLKNEIFMGWGKPADRVKDYYRAMNVIWKPTEDDMLVIAQLQRDLHLAKELELKMQLEKQKEDEEEQESEEQSSDEEDQEMSNGEENPED